MGKKAPKAPKAPDPYATAQAQGQMNIDTAIANANLNRINQYTPEGSLTFQRIGTNPDGTPQYQSTQTYSPEQQKLYENELAVSNALSGLSLQNVGRVADAQSRPFDYSGMTPLQSQIGQPNVSQGYDTGGGIQRGYGMGDVRSTYDAGGNIQQGFNGGPGVQYGFGGGGDIASGYGSGGDLQRQYNFGGLNAIPGTSDYGAEAKRVQDAVYNQATSRLDPQWEQQQRQLAATLAGKGVSENSEAYRRAMDQMTRQRTDAYNQANFSGIQAGAQEQSRLFGLALSGRQQGVNEAMAQGQFGNQAQQIAEQQNAARAAFGNQAQAQRFGQSQAMADFYNQAQAQNFGQSQTQAAFGNQAQAQQNAQNLQAANFYNQGQGQWTQQQADQAQFANMAQAQANQQNMGQAAFGNQAAGQIFGMNQANANFNNQARQQQIQEATYLRNLPLNEISALMGAAGGVAQPQFADYAQANVAGTDYSGLVQNNFNNQMNLYQQKLAQQQSALGSIFGLAGSIGGAAMLSDRRAKEAFKAIGKLANGLTTYAFNYIGQKARQFGVMADEVLQIVPEAVGVNDNGYLTVDYGKVYAHGG